MNKNLVTYLCWFISIIATAGSLFFSEVMEFPPCTLCWYQRIAMYPLVVIFLVGSFRGALETVYFSAPLVIIGWLIAIYHNLIHMEIIPESASPCMEGISCGTVYIEWLGFITIPILSFTAFSIIGLFLIVLFKGNINEK